MSGTVWRVDSELLTIVEVQVTELSLGWELEAWYPAMIGNGYYAYFETEAQAKMELLEIMKYKRTYLETVISQLEVK